jgi:Cu(I)/Ag(I) efflux system membrane protein CusA/SilA
MKRRSSLSFALTGGTWFVYLKGYNLSLATAVGFVAPAGVAAELGVVVMLLHLKHATAAQIENGHGWPGRRRSGWLRSTPSSCRSTRGAWARKALPTRSS